MYICDKRPENEIKGTVLFKPPKGMEYSRRNSAKYKACALRTTEQCCQKRAT